MSVQETILMVKKIFEAHLENVAVICQPIPPAAESRVREGQAVGILEYVEAELLPQLLETVSRLNDDEAGDVREVATELVATLHEQQF